MRLGANVKQQLFDLAMNIAGGRPQRLVAPRSRYRRNLYGSHGDTDEGFTWTRKADQIRQEAALDGLYVVRTSVPEQIL